MKTRRNIHIIQSVTDCPLHDDVTLTYCINHCEYFKGHYEATNQVICGKSEDVEEPKGIMSLF